MCMKYKKMQNHIVVIFHMLKHFNMMYFSNHINIHFNNFMYFYIVRGKLIIIHFIQLLFIVHLLI